MKNTRHMTWMHPEAPCRLSGAPGQASHLHALELGVPRHAGQSKALWMCWTSISSDVCYPRVVRPLLLRIVICQTAWCTIEATAKKHSCSMNVSMQLHKNDNNYIDRTNRTKVQLCLWGSVVVPLQVAIGLP